MADMPDQLETDRTRKLQNLAPWIEQEALPPHLVALAEKLADAVAAHTQCNASSDETVGGG